MLQDHTKLSNDICHELHSSNNYINNNIIKQNYRQERKKNLIIDDKKFTL